MSRKHQVGIAVRAAILSGVSAAPTSADVIHWHLPGVIDGSFQCFDPELPCQATDDNAFLLQFFPVGTHVDFDLAIDTQDFCSSPNVGLYEIKELDVTINGVTARGPFAGVLEKPDNNGCSFDDPVGDTHVRAAVAFDELFSVVEMFFGLSPGDDLPTVLPPGGFYLERSPSVRALGGQTGPSSIVPEPSTLLLVFSGLAAVATRHRRR
jgi:PEP-CTERM motif